MRVRPAALAVLTLLAAVIGGVSVLVIGKAAGWVGGTSKNTVVVSVPRTAQAVASQRSLPLNTRPASGGAFVPSRIYKLRAPGVVTIYAITGSDNSASGQEAQGSGFVVSGQGYILTNSHVITNAGEGAKKIKAADRLVVEFRDRDRVPATVVGWDIFDDVGLIKVDPAAHSLAPVPLGNSASAQVGEPVAAIGSPFGNVSSLSVGVVSAVRRSIESLTAPNYSLVDAIQTDAPINHGNSGGPLFDAQGRVIGINAQIRSDTGAADGVGFAVPINSARRSMLQLIAAGRVSYAYVGIETQDLIPTVAKRLGYGVRHGAVVMAVTPNSPGAAAGFHAVSSREQLLGSTFGRGGDVIVSIAGHPVASAEDVVRVVTTELSPGESVPIGFYRGRQRRTVTVKLAQRPANPG
jgi:S1-C subfamily serine protease